MILVIADDFTGAAEIGGIAARFGLKTEVQTEFVIQPDVDVIVVDTNTRSKSAEEASIILDELLGSIRQYKFDFYYKKTDSVLRGHVYEELSVLLKYESDKSILLVPTNPSRGRTISNGIYFIDGTPIHETFFSADPESPVVASDIYSLIHGADEDSIKVLEPFEPIPQDSGMIYLGEAKNRDEVVYWANQMDKRIIYAGAADFFEAILGLTISEPQNDRAKIDFESRNTLFVCGSSLSRVVNIEEELFSKNPKVVEVPESQICSDNNSAMTDEIAKKVIDHFESTNNVILFVTTSETDGNIDQPKKNIPKCLAAITSTIVSKIELDELIIEGGTTSSEVVRKVGWSRFKPVDQIGKGLIRMETIQNSSNFISVKPGSYKWTDDVWRQLKS